MRTSSNRILTTHTGSLPRPGRLAGGDHASLPPGAVASAVAQSVGRQCAAGGVTTSVAMPNVSPPPTTAENLDAMLELYRARASFDYNVNASGVQLDEIPKLAERGILAFKIFMVVDTGRSYPHMPGIGLHEHGELYKRMKAVKATGVSLKGDLLLTAEGLRGLGHEVHLFCGEYGVLPPAGVIAHRVPLVPLGRTARLWSFAFVAPRLLRRARCDVVVNFGRLLSAFRKVDPHEPSLWEIDDARPSGRITGDSDIGALKPPGSCTLELVPTLPISGHNTPSGAAGSDCDSAYPFQSPVAPLDAMATIRPGGQTQREESWRRTRESERNFGVSLA